VVFHDGTPFNAEAVAYNVDRVQNHPNTKVPADLESVETVDVVDDYTVQFNLNKPDSGLVGVLSDRAGMMAVFYRHFHLGEPMSVAIEQLSKRYLHHREGLTGVLDYTLEKYVAEVEPTGVSFEDWVESDAYDPKAIRAEFKAGWWGTLLTEKLLRRE
jgi:ABC-type transport system substrate-binding protein